MKTFVAGAVLAGFASLCRAAAPDTSVDDAFRAHPSGVCVILGAGDGSLAVRAAEGGRRIVHVLEADPAKVAAARQTLADKRAAGLAVVEPWTAASLPYSENLVNLLIAESPAAEPEMLRVLIPGGTALVKRDGKWAAVRKPKSADFDEWTHWRHGADGNMVSRDRAVSAPTGLRWVAGPPQDAGGKKWYYDHVLITANGRNYYDYEDAVVARDAYNGVHLWTRELKAHTFRESGLPLPPNPTPKMKLAVRTSKVRPVAAGDRLFVAAGGKILALDGATGATTAEFGDTTEPRELLLVDGTLFVSEAKSVRAFDAESKKLIWEAAIEARRVVATGAGLFVVTPKEVVGLDRATGKELWRKPDAEAALALTCTAHEGWLVLEKSTLRDDPTGCGIKVYSTKTGELLWARDFKPDMTHYREARAYFAQGLLWLPVENEGLLGLDPANGSQRKKWGTRAKHCATPVATDRFFLAPECEFTDLADGKQTRSRMFKSACRQPFIPANGLLYTFPVQCECFPMLRGTMGLSSDALPAAGAIAGARLEKGPAATGEIKTAAGADDWPTYRRDIYRSSAAPTALRRTDVARVWETSVADMPDGPVPAEWKANPYTKGTLTAPVAAGGMVFVGVPDLHRIVALDAKTGKIAWTFTADGRVDGPPTIHAGLCLFGAHDGRVYGLRAADGALMWKLRAAPREARIAAYGQLESPWPVVSSVLVDGGLAYVAAGRHPTADGGIQVLAIKPATGDVVWEKTVFGLDPITRWYGGTLAGSKVKVGVDFEPVDMLVRDGDTVAMSRWRFNPADGDFKLAVNSVTYETPGLAVPRGLWGYGIRQTKMVQPRPAAAFADGKFLTGLRGDAAVIVAGGAVVRIDGKGNLRFGATAAAPAVNLDVEPVPDGLISAGGALYLTTQKGTVLRIE